MNIDWTMPQSLTLDVFHVALLLLVMVLIVVLTVMTRCGSNTPTKADPCDRDASQAEDKKGAKTVSEPAASELPPTVPPASLRELSPDAALQLLALLQQEARLIDFLSEDLTGFSDADIGGVARVVHKGGKRVLSAYFVLEPIRKEAEEERIEVGPDFDAQAVRLTGNVKGEPPYRGVLTHRGWRIREVKLPQLASGHKAEIIAPAEVEL